MTSPCLGPELSLDAGNRVQVNLCGPPPQQDWPFPCSPTENNGLHRDDDGCLWVTPQTTGAAGVLGNQVNCGFFCFYSSSRAVFSSAVVTLSVTNPETCRNRDYFIHTDYQWLFTPSSGVTTITQCFRQVTGVDNADAGWVQVYTADSGSAHQLRMASSDPWVMKNVAPGETRVVTVGMRVNAQIGSGNLNSFIARVGGVSIPSN